MKQRPSLDNLLTQTQAINTRFDRLGEEYVRKNVSGSPEVELWAIVEALVSHVKELQERLGDHDHRRLGEYHGTID